MKEKIIYIFWSVVFLLTGAGLLAGLIDYNEISDQTWFRVEIVGSAAFVVTYFLAGTKKWGWLLPAFVFAGMAVDLSSELYHTFLSQTNGVPIMIGIALWFLTGFLIDRRRWGLLIPAYILVFAIVETVVNTVVVPSILRGEDNEFLLVYLTSGATIMFMLALPFFVVYFVSKKSWWALIPAGTFTSIGLVITMYYMVEGNFDTQAGIFSSVLLLGLAATFGILWLRRQTAPTDWARKSRLWRDCAAKASAGKEFLPEILLGFLRTGRAARAPGRTPLNRKTPVLGERTSCPPVPRNELRLMSFTHNALTSGPG